MNKLLNRIVWPIIAIPLVYLAFVWKKLPDRIAVHFNLEGTPDRFGSKNELLVMALVLTGMNILIYLILPNIYRIDPKKYAAENKPRLQRIAFVICVFMAAILCLLIFASMEGSMKFSTKWIFAGVGLLFCFIGNYMHTIKPNYFAGFRLPWTLENEENWKKTHLLGGKLFFAGGLLIAVLCLLVPVKVSIIVFFSVTITVTLIPCIYSYLLYRKMSPKQTK